MIQMAAGAIVWVLSIILAVAAASAGSEAPLHTSRTTAVKGSATDTLAGGKHPGC